MTAFWQEKSLKQMNKDEWESLCDGCAKCCLQKLENIDTNEVFYTSVACRLLDIETCQCTNYQNRHQLVSNCIWLNSHNAKTLTWLPATCAYRLISEGKPLPIWHPLVSGTTESVFDAGVSVASFAINEDDQIDLEEFIIPNLAD